MSESNPSDASGHSGKTPVLRWIVLAVVLVAGLWFGIDALRKAEPAGAGASAGGGAAGGTPPATVIADPVIQKPVQERRRVTGTLRAVKRAGVAAQESGTVLEVLADVGDAVGEGDVLVRLDRRRLEASLAEAEARLVAAGSGIEERAAEAERAALDFERMEKLYRQRAVSEREFLDAKREATVSAARKNVADEEFSAAESVRDLLRVRLDDLEVRAPFAGRIVERSVDPGEWLSPGSSVATLISSGTIEAWMDVPERFIAEIAEAAGELEVVVDGNGMRTAAQAIRRVADVDPVTRLFPVVVEVDDHGGLLAPGLSVHAELPVGEERELLAVPVDAVIETFQGASVFRVAPSPDGEMPIAERVRVEVAFREDGFVFVEAGAMRPGETVVVEGNERLFPGTPLIVDEPEKSAPKEAVEGVKP